MARKRSQGKPPALPDIGWKQLASNVITAAFDAAKANPIMAASVGSFPFSLMRIALGHDRYWEAREVVNAHWNNAANMTFPQIATPRFSFGGSGAPPVARAVAGQDISKILELFMKKPKE